MAIESVQRLTKLTEAEVKNELKEFKIWAYASGAVEHANLRDLQGHFAKWLVGKLEHEKKQKKAAPATSTIMTDNNDKNKYDNMRKWK